MNDLARGAGGEPGNVEDLANAELVLGGVIVEAKSTAGIDRLFSDDVLRLLVFVKRYAPGRFFELTALIEDARVRRELDDRLRDLAKTRGWVSDLIGGPSIDGLADALPTFSFDDAVVADFKVPGYIVKSWVDEGDLATWFGESGSMKSFVLIDLAFKVAAGLPWWGLRTRQTACLYVAGEGVIGVRKRLRALFLKHLDQLSGQVVPLHVTEAAADLMRQPGRIKATIDEAEGILGRRVGLVVFDTLSANFGPGDDGLTGDMLQVLANARQACGSRSICLVHHVGHGDKGRERGSYALRGAADRRVKIELAQDGCSVQLSVEKAKDERKPESIVLGWQEVALDWRDSDGDELTSLVLEQFDGQFVASKKGPPRSHDAVLAYLAASGGATRAEIWKALEAQGIAKRSIVYRAIRELLDTGMVMEAMNKVYLVGAESGGEA